MTEPPYATILYIDDSATHAEVRLLRAVLEKAGYRLLTARSANEALAVLRTSAIDLVLTEYIMPAGGGPSIADRLKNLNSQIPVAIYSVEWKMPAASATALFFISKLVPVEELLGSIQELLKAAHTRVAA